MGLKRPEYLLVPHAISGNLVVGTAPGLKLWQVCCANDGAYTIGAKVSQKTFRARTFLVKRPRGSAHRTRKHDRRPPTYPNEPQKPGPRILQRTPRAAPKAPKTLPKIRFPNFPFPGEGPPNFEGVENAPNVTNSKVFLIPAPLPAPSHPGVTGPRLGLPGVPV